MISFVAKVVWEDVKLAKLAYKWVTRVGEEGNAAEFPELSWRECWTRCGEQLWYPPVTPSESDQLIPSSPPAGSYIHILVTWPQGKMSDLQGCYQEWLLYWALTVFLHYPAHFILTTTTWRRKHYKVILQKRKLRPREASIYMCIYMCVCVCVRVHTHIKQPVDAEL